MERIGGEKQPKRADAQTVDGKRVPGRLTSDAMVARRDTERVGEEWRRTNIEIGHCCWRR